MAIPTLIMVGVTVFILVRIIPGDPASLMLGFFADAVTEDLVRSEEELEDLQWFTRQELADGGAGIAKRPRSDSIARRLIDEWIRMGG